MFDQLKHTFKHTAIYSLGNISTKLIGFILLPLYTNPLYLSTTEYGIWATLEITAQILVGVLSLNLPIAMLRWSSEKKKEEEIGSVIFTSAIALLGIIALTLLFLMPNTDFFSNLLFSSSKFSRYFFFLFIYVSIGIYNGIPLNVLRLKEKSVYYVTATVLKFTTILILNIYFVVYRHEGVVGIIKGQLIGETMLAIVTLPMILKSFTYRFEKNTMVQMVKYGSPLVLSSVSAFIISFGDRYILLHFLDKASVGIYSVGYKISSVINMLILQSFQLGFLPIAYKKLGDKDEKRFFSKILTYYSLILTFTALGVSLFGYEIIELFTKDKAYFAAVPVIPIIALTFVLKGIQYNFALAFHYTKKTYYNAGIVIFTAVLNVSLNFFLIPRIGIIGAAISMLTSIFVMTLISYYFEQKVYPLPFEIGKILKIVTVGILFFLASLFFFSSFGLLARILLKLFLLLLILFVFWKINIFEEVEILRTKETIAKLFGRNK